MKNVLKCESKSVKKSVGPLNFFLGYFLKNLSVQKCSKFIEEFISKNPLLLESLKKNEIQVKLTVIDENEIFSEYEYNIDEKKYFYPASTVKLPIALLALEKLNVGVPLFVVKSEYPGLRFWILCTIFITDLLSGC